jgi:sugar phosphate isomerase/epimerase
MTARPGYALSGFSGHRLADACAVVASIGYPAVGLTLGQPHLDPFGDLPRQVTHARRCLEAHHLEAVVETDGSWVLDPWRPDEPALVSDDGSARRVELLRRAVRIAHHLGADVVTCAAGAAPLRTPTTAVWHRLVDGLAEVLEDAAALEVRVCVEPRPGHFLGTVDDALALRARLGRPEHLGLTLDLGALADGGADPVASVRAALPALGHVRVTGLEPGGPTGVGVAAALGFLAGTAYDGVVCAASPRHAHAAPYAARSAMGVLRESVTRRPVAADHRPTGHSTGSGP